MADVRAPFPTVQDGSGVGVVLDEAIDATTPAAALVGSVGFAFKDSSGNVVLPALDAMGRLPVSSASPGTPLRAHGGVAGGTTYQTIATIALTATKVYNTISALIACRRGALFQIVQIDDVTTTVLYEMILDAGQFTFQLSDVDELCIAGATGTQSLILKAKNFTAGDISDLHGTIKTIEAP